MSRSVRDFFLFVVVVGFALPGSARTPAASQVKEPLQLTVRVYDYAGQSEVDVGIPRPELLTQLFSSDNLAWTIEQGSQHLERLLLELELAAVFP